MPTRAMIIVAGGSSSRFGADKLMLDVDGQPLIAHTIDAIVDHVDTCVVACRPDALEAIEALERPIKATAGGSSRTLSEMAGLAAIGEAADLIGIHDAARPVVDGDLIDRLFAAADDVGGAIPIVESDGVLLNRKNHDRVEGMAMAQTPQVFRADILMTAYVKAAREGFEGHDTAEVVQRFTDAAVAAVPGDAKNIKVTYPTDLAAVTESLRARPRT
jgi:2-C-methyl-D-erythritol 4-phosphate cytidylyltransferase